MMSFSDDSAYTLIGRITKPQGHRGAMRMMPEFEPLERFEGLKSDEIYLHPPSSRVAPAPAVLPKGKAHRGLAHVEGFFYHGQFVVLELTEIQDMNAAELLRDYEVYVRDEDLWDLEEGEFLVHELEGFQIVHAQEGRLLGSLAGIQPGAAHDFLRVQPPGGREYLIPFSKAIVVEVNRSTRQLLVNPPPGLDEI